MGVLIPDSVERASVDENFEAVSAVAWTIIQHVRSDHDKMRRFLTEAQTKVSKADEKIDSLTVKLKESKDTCASLAAELVKAKEELSSVKEECGHVAMELGSYFGGKARLELMEEHVDGKQDERDLEATHQDSKRTILTDVRTSSTYTRWDSLATRRTRARRAPVVMIPQAPSTKAPAKPPMPTLPSEPACRSF